LERTLIVHLMNLKGIRLMPFVFIY